MHCFRYATLGVVAALMAAMACSNDGSSGREGIAGKPAFIVHSAMEGSDGERTNYFTVVDSLSQMSRLDYGNSLEVSGRARMYVEPGMNFLAIGDAENLTITRYDLSEDGSFARGNSMSLQPYAVGWMATRGVLFVSESKAYYKDDSQGQLIVWNPTKMTVERTIPLPEGVMRDGRETVLGQWSKRGKDAFFSVSWTSLEYDRVDPGSMLVHLDTETDEITVTEESRCRGLWQAAVYEETIYFFSEVINAFGYAVYGEQGGQQDCILRVLPKDKTFDPEYLGTIAPALDSHEIGTGVAISNDGRVWYQVVDTNLVPTAPGTTYSEWYGNGWTWQNFDLETLGDRQKATLEPGAYAGSAFVTDEGFFVSASAADYSLTRLVKIAAEGAQDGLSYPGFTLDVASLR